jgi:hypothetical protein
MSRNAENDKSNRNNIAHRITSLARHLSAGCHRQETLTLRTGCRNQELRTNIHGISGSASIYLSHSTNFDSIRSMTVSLALDSFDKYLRRVSRKTISSIGLCKISAAPAASARFVRSVALNAVLITIGMSLIAGFALMRSVASAPLIPGKPRSMRIRSGCVALA